MSTQPEALRLADALEKYDICSSIEAMPDLDEVAAELRRLHFELQCANAAITARDKVFEINQELREALLAIRNSAYMPHGLIGLLDAAIAKAEGEKQ